MPHSALNRRRAAAAMLLSSFLLAATQGCGSSTSCGPGTVLSGSECVLSGTGGSTGTTGTTGSTTATTTTGTGGSVGSGGGRPCTTQCDCFSGTTCAVGGTCESSSLTGACDDECQVDSDCPCGRSCDKGACAMPTTPMFAGAGTACQADCDCPGNGGNAQRCVGGRCILPCDVIGPQCVDDSACSACNEVCLADGACAALGQCYNVVDCLTLAGEVCSSGTCVAPPGTRYATGDALPATEDMMGVIMVTVDVPAGVTVTGLVVVLDATLDPTMPPTGAIALMGPGGATVTLATSFAWSVAENDLTRVTYPSLAQPPPAMQPDLAPFEGKSGSGTWTLTVDQAAGLEVANLALYIK